MVTKLMAADIATRSGCGVVITSGLRAALLPELFSGNKPTFEATLFAAQPASMNARRRHLAFFEAPCGSLTIDAGAVHALRHKGASLLAKGCTALSGSFEEGDVIEVRDASGEEVGRGRSQFSASALQPMLGHDMGAMAKNFQGRTRFEVIHRDDLVLSQPAPQS
jgi:glutamate 5-kinase